MSFLDTASVHLFTRPTERTPESTLSLAEALHMMQDGRYEQRVRKLRTLFAAQGEEAYTAAKRQLAAVTFCGTFNPTRAKGNLTQHNGMVHGDLDHLEDVQAVKQALCADPHTVYCFISPSGEGVKVGVRVEPVADDAAYKHAWQAVADYHQQRYGVTWDPSGKDVSRLCYVSHDAELYRNADAKLFTVAQYSPPQPTPRPLRPAAEIPADRRERYALQALTTAVGIIDASTPGNLHEARLRAGKLLGGYVGGDILSYADAYSALEVAVERNTVDFDRSMKTIADALDHGQTEPITLDELEAEHQEWGEQRRQRTQHTPPTREPGASNGTPPPVPPQQTTQAAEAEPSLPWSDTTNALALVRAHGQDLRYCWPWKKWLVWTGNHWTVDDTGTVRQHAKQTVKRLARYAENLEDAEARALMAHVKSSLATTKIKAMIEGAQDEPGIPVKPEALDTDRWLLNCTNGTLDLKAGTLQPHTRADLLTRCMPVAFDPEATCPTWTRFLWRIMGGTVAPDDPEMSTSQLEARQAADDRAQRFIAFLQRAIGYSLTGDTREQCLFLLHGSGANGKSTFLEALQALLGDFAQSTPSASLLAKDRHDRIPNDIAGLRGARLVTAVEIGDGKRLDEELVKRLTGQDTMKARFLFAEWFSFTPEFKLWIACNHLPTIQGTDHAIWRRIRLIPFAVTILDEEQDKDLPTKLRAELPGILRWVVQGCRDWQQHGLGMPEEVKAATAGYRASMDVLGRFIEECCLVSPQVRVKASALYEAYKQWCQPNGEPIATMSAFGNAMEQRGFIRHKVGTIWRLGIGISPPTEKAE